ncbi:MAG TPA: helix-turn-helix transcriptional regulator [Candidatus Acidoferrales bacterium]|nr:helix-turn-helix transcriptional regulator [Candidatus Acidoferrales bacterium]
MNYGKAIKIARAIAGLQQKELAKRADIDPSLVSLMEKGKRQPSVQSLEKLSKALHVPPYLLTLMATEDDDVRISDPVELKRISEVLARFLLRDIREEMHSRGKRRSVSR